VSPVVDTVLSRLDATGVPVRAATDRDAVDGVAASVVASPTDTAGAAALLRAAAEEGLAVVARGTATKLDWGLPPLRVDVLLDTTAMSRVVEHAAGDLVVHVQAGVTVGQLQEALAGANQRLALDPLTNPDAEGRGTVGGMLATGADGPLRFSHGAVRDLVIGVTVVRADGVVARAGGRVVKNVAGYDLSKLMTGSWGTLGVITEAIFRLHPRPPASRWVVHTAPDAARQARLAAQSQAVPAAVEIDQAAGAEPTVGVLVDGVPEGVDARAEALRDILGGGAITDSAPSWWGRAPWEAGGTAVRLTSTLTGVDRLLAGCMDLPLRPAVRGSAGGGKLHAAFPRAADAGLVARCVELLRDRAEEWGGDVVVLRAPADVRAAVDSWGPVPALALMRRIKTEFDPERRLAPGRFVGGI
jgi:glycolate dehydrogenase FAD-binding subunit